MDAVRESIRFSSAKGAGIRKSFGAFVFPFKRSYFSLGLLAQTKAHRTLGRPQRSPVQ